jgi:hypothetical protein
MSPPEPQHNRKTISRQEYSVNYRRLLYRVSEEQKNPYQKLKTFPGAMKAKFPNLVVA